MSGVEFEKSGGTLKYTKNSSDDILNYAKRCVGWDQSKYTKNVATQYDYHQITNRSSLSGLNSKELLTR